MAKEIKQEQIKDTIKDLPLLRKEFERGQMIDRKLIALRNKLIELHSGKVASNDEISFLGIILKRDRVKGQITDLHTEILNRMEIEKCNEKAYVKIDSAPRVHFLQKDMVCRYYKDAEKDRFVIFVEKTIPVSHQLTEDLILREMRGHFPAEEEYPKERKLLHRLDITPKEFEAWFEILDEGVLSAEKEQQFEF